MKGSVNPPVSKKRYAGKLASHTWSTPSTSHPLVSTETHIVAITKWHHFPAMKKKKKKKHLQMEFRKKVEATNALVVTIVVTWTHTGSY